MSDIERRLAKAEQYVRGYGRGGRGSLQLICIRGGIPTESGEPEAKIGGTVLVREPGEDIEEFKARVTTEAQLLGLSFAVISGLPPRDQAIDDDYPR